MKAEHTSWSRRKRQAITDHCKMYFYKFLSVFVEMVKCICQHCSIYFHLNTLIHFQYESSLRFMEQKEEAVFHRQTPPEYHKIAKKKSKLEFHTLSSQENILIKKSKLECHKIAKKKSN